MQTSTYDTDTDGDVDTAAGGTEWDSSAATGVAYITGGSWSAVSKGIADTNFVVIDGTPNDDEYARFTANGLEGRTEAEFKADFNLEIGTDVLAYDATLSSIADLGTGADKLAYTTGVDTWAETGLTSFARSILDDADEATFKATVNLEVGTDVLAQQTIGIADDNLMEVDDADAADNDYVKFTANGFEGREGSEVLGDLSGTATSTFDWNGQILADWGIESGATIDASPTTGQFFLHTPTGRAVLLQYDGSNWQPIQSFGTMTVYVDNTDGTDGIKYGGGVDADAFNTIQYAIDQVPSSFGDDVTVNVNAETYSELVEIQGKSPTGSHDLTIQGTLSEQETATADSMVAGSGATQGTLTDTGAFTGDSYANLLLHVATLGKYRVIDSHTDDVLTIVGTFGGSGAYDWTVYDWGTVIQGVYVRDGQIAVKVNDCEIGVSDTTTCLSCYHGGAVTLTRCKLRGIVFASASGSGSYIQTNQCFHFSKSVSYGFLIRNSSYVDVRYSKFWNNCDTSGSASAFDVRDGGVLYAYYGGNVITGYGASNDAEYGIEVFNNGAVLIGTSSGYMRIREFDYGIKSAIGGMVTGTNNIQYSNINTANEDADASSFAYID